MKILGIVAVGVVRDGVPKIVRAPICRAHCAVIFAIAQLSCNDWFNIHGDAYILSAEKM